MATSETPSYPILRELAAGGMACSIAGALTNPLDVIKVRIQVQRQIGGLSTNLLYTTFSQTAKRIFVEEGLRGIYLPGLTASVLREISYSSIRFGLYSHVKTLYGMTPGQDPGLLTKLAAGMTTGAIGSCLANPTDLVKIRQQAEAGLVDRNGVYTTGLHKGMKRSYNNTFHAFYEIGRLEGLKGLYKGVEATAARAALLTAGQMASYDHSKHLLKKYNIMNEGIPLHISSSVIAGLCAATMAAPADLIKSRVMGDKARAQYSGVVDCIYKTLRYEGVRTFFKGWLPSYLRIAPHFIISLPLFEQCRKLFGLQNL
ncbi:mitochondrial substrate carrier family protein ucpB-like protein [Paraphysoderma sedebokerense]|nr:mitochondrial substrate carrier family protein ucpB-like protein [Paraphysoderma sedebokerense]